MCLKTFIQILRSVGRRHIQFFTSALEHSCGVTGCSRDILSETRFYDVSSVCLWTAGLLKQSCIQLHHNNSVYLISLFRCTSIAGVPLRHCAIINNNFDFPSLRRPFNLNLRLLHIIIIYCEFINRDKLQGVIWKIIETASVIFYVYLYSRLV